MAGIINSSTVAGLTLEYLFEAVPDCPAATEAGWTSDDRAAAQNWYPPVIDGDYFYSCLWNGNATDLVHKSSILVCRKTIDGSLIWTANTGSFAVDTAPNVFGDSSVVCRPWLFIYLDTIYLVKSNISNIGPELYAINKATGTLKWACAFYPPAGLPDLVTTTGDYSAYTGSNMRLGDCPPIASNVTVGGVQKRYVFVGSSSFQNNWNLNYGINGFPLYTDQGHLFCIEDQGTHPALVWKVSACAPELKVGDTLVKGGNPVYDPFQPGSTQVTFVTQTSKSSPPSPMDNYFVHV